MFIIAYQLKNVYTSTVVFLFNDSKGIIMLFKNSIQAVLVVGLCLNFFSLTAGKKKNNKSFAQYWISSEQVKYFLSKSSNIEVIIQVSDKSGVIDKKALKNEINNCFDNAIASFTFKSDLNLGDLLQHCFGDSSTPPEDVKRAMSKDIGDLNKKELKKNQQTALWRFSRTWPLYYNKNNAKNDLIALLSQHIFNIVRSSESLKHGEDVWLGITILRSADDRWAIKVCSIVDANQELSFEEKDGLSPHYTVVCLQPVCLQHGDFLNEVAAAAGPNLKLMVLGSVAGMVVYTGLMVYENFMASL